MYQVDEQEGHISIDYFTGNVIAYCNRASVCRRLLKYLPTGSYEILESEYDSNTETGNCEIVSLKVKLSMDKVGLLLQSRIWKVAKRYK